VEAKASKTDAETGRAATTMLPRDSKSIVDDHRSAHKRKTQAQVRAACFRPFVTLLTARPQGSGVTALILARFYMSPPRRSNRHGLDASESEPYRLIPDSHCAPQVRGCQ